jgi:hypothetical protein
VAQSLSSLIQTRSALGGQRLGYWQRPLGYSHAVLITLTSIGIGVFFHGQIGYGLMPTATTLTWAVVIFSVLLFTTCRMWRENRIVQFFCGIPFAIVTTSAVVLLAVAGGTLTLEQTQEQFGIESVFGSWPFFFAVFLMQVNLIGSAARRAWPLTRTNLTYQLMHLGLATAVFSGGIGAAGLERLNMVCFYGIPTNIAYDKDERAIEMPFTLTLREFQMERFPPTLAIATMDQHAKDGYRLAPGTKFAADGMREKIGEYEVEVVKYLPQAALVGEQYHEYHEKTSTPAVFAKVLNGEGETVRAGWVAAGSVDSAGAILEVDNLTALAMPSLRPKKFRSELTLTRNGEDEPISVEVNKPFGFSGVRLYQLSYDEQMGPASHYSVVEVVRDHSIPAVYTGMLMLLSGVFIMLWNGIGPSARRLKNAPR